MISQSLQKSFKEKNFLSQNDFSSVEDNVNSFFSLMKMPKKSVYLKPEISNFKLPNNLNCKSLYFNTEWKIICLDIYTCGATNLLYINAFNEEWIFNLDNSNYII